MRLERKEMAERIPEHLIQEILAANDITDIVGKYVSLKRAGSSMVGLCPFHKEKTPSFHVSPDRQVYHCFGCGAGGGVVDFVKNIENLDFVESIKFLAERANIKIETQDFADKDSKLYEKKKAILEANLETARYFRSMLFAKEGAKAMEYAKKRGLSDTTIKIYGLGFAPETWDSLVKHLLSKGFKKDLLLEAGLIAMSEKGRAYDRFRNRLMFPIIDVRGNIIGFGGRALGEDKAKYLNSAETPVFNKRKNLFSLNLAKNSGTGELILVEGYMDVISLYQSGIKNAVASLGTALTAEQARLISRFAGTVTICYDTDEAGVNATERAIEIFDGLDIKVHILELPEGKDPDEFIKKNSAQLFIDQVKKAKTISEYRIEKLKKKYDIKNDTQKIEYLGECVNILLGVKGSIERDFLVNKLANETGIAPQAIETEINKKSRRKDKKNERDIMKQAVMPKRQKGSDFSQSEKRLISLCTADRKLLQKFNITEELFEATVHKKVISKLLENKDSSLIVTEFAEEEASYAASAMAMPLNYEDNEKAAVELINTIKKEQHDASVKKAISEGNIEVLNALLLKKQREEASQ